MTVNQLIQQLLALKEHGAGEKIVLDADGFAISGTDVIKADMDSEHAEWGFDEGDEFVQLDSCR